MKLLSIFFCLLLTICSLSVSAVPTEKRKKVTHRNTKQGNVDETHVNFVYDIDIKTYDNFTLHANAFYPDQTTPGQQFPLIVFPNSWACPDIEYIAKIFSWSEGGYATVEYETRGWYFSGGQIDVAGPQDRRDITSVLDHILNTYGEKWNINASAVGFSGVSYGAGLSIFSAGDPRVKAIAAMSGWFNLTESLFPSESPAKNTVELLVSISELVGHPSQELINAEIELVNYKNISGLVEFGNRRSPATVIDQINQRNIPILFSTNSQDQFFPPQVSFKYFQRITSPKMFLFNQGAHAEAEMFGLFDVPSNFVFDHAKRWFDYWLLGLPTGVMQEPMVQMEAGNSLFSRNYVPFKNWPAPQGSFENQVYYFQTRGSDTFGGLSTSPNSFENVQLKKHHHHDSAPPRLFSHLHNKIKGDPLDTISFSFFPGLYVPGFILQYITPLGIGFDQELLLSSKATSIVYRTPTVSASTTICGIPRINITLTPNSNNWQLYAFVYEINGLDVARLLSYAAYSRFRQPASVAGTPQKISGWEMRPICTVLEAGNRLGLGFALNNDLFEQASNSTEYAVEFNYDGASFTVPFVPH